MLEDFKGCPFTPIIKNGKNPFKSGWNKYENSYNYEEIIEEKNHGYNVGILTGYEYEELGYHWVLDTDTPRASEFANYFLEGNLTTRTSQDYKQHYHLFCTSPVASAKIPLDDKEEQELYNTTSIIDIKSIGGCVVAPNSTYANGTVSQTVNNNFKAIFSHEGRNNFINDLVEYSKDKSKNLTDYDIENFDIEYITYKPFNLIEKESFTELVQENTEAVIMQDTEENSENVVEYRSENRSECNINNKDKVINNKVNLLEIANNSIKDYTLNNLGISFIEITDYFDAEKVQRYNTIAKRSFDCYATRGEVTHIFLDEENSLQFANRNIILYEKHISKIAEFSKQIQNDSHLYLVYCKLSERLEAFEIVSPLDFEEMKGYTVEEIFESIPKFKQMQRSKLMNLKKNGNTQARKDMLALKSDKLHLGNDRNYRVFNYMAYKNYSKDFMQSIYNNMIQRNSITSFDSYYNYAINNKNES